MSRRLPPTFIPATPTSHPRITCPAPSRNVNGSFYDFVAECYHGTSRTVLTEPLDRWSGRAAVDWAERLASGERYSLQAEEYIQVARVLDQMYGR